LYFRHDFDFLNIGDFLGEKKVKERIGTQVASTIAPRTSRNGRERWADHHSDPLEAKGMKMKRSRSKESVPFSVGRQNRAQMSVFAGLRGRKTGRKGRAKIKKSLPTAALIHNKIDGGEKDMAMAGGVRATAHCTRTVQSNLLRQSRLGEVWGRREPKRHRERSDSF